MIRWFLWCSLTQKTICMLVHLHNICFTLSFLRGCFVAWKVAYGTNFNNFAISQAFMGFSNSTATNQKTLWMSVLLVAFALSIYQIEKTIVAGYWTTTITVPQLKIIYKRNLIGNLFVMKYKISPSLIHSLLWYHIDVRFDII